MWEAARKAVYRILPTLTAPYRRYKTSITLKHRCTTCPGMATKCHLVCQQNSHGPISLPDKTVVSLGRGPEMKIKDCKCSRKQFELTADFSNRYVKMRQIGPNPSSVEGKVDTLSVNEETTLKDGDILYVVKGKYPHIIKFEGEKTAADVESKQGENSNKKNKSIAEYFSKSKSDDQDRLKSRKRTLDEDFDDESSKRLKSEDVKESTNNASVKGNPQKDEISDNDSDEEEREIKKRLQTMKETFQKMSSPETQDKASASAGSISHDSSSHDNLELGSHGNRELGTPTTEAKWESKQKLMIYTSKGVCSSSKIAGFDLDGTIITTSSGRVFPINIGDWRILYPDIPKKLKKLLADGFKLVFFTNQSGISRGKMTEQDFQKKVENITGKLNIPVQVFVSTGSGLYRKPSLGVWNVLINEKNDQIQVDLSQSFYVGDAAGRPENKIEKKKKDFSCGDRLFALNIGIKFYTPEEFFLGHKPASFNMPEFDPRNLKSDVTVLSPSTASITSSQQEVVLMVGIPACGKSTFVSQHLVPDGYVQVNRDTLGTWQKCVQACDRALKEGKKVAVDNTNPDKETRKRYIDCAKKAGVSCRCFVFTASFNHCKHNERFRELTDSKHQHINDMIFNSFKSKYQEPDKSEGFSEIVKVNFVPKFKSKSQEKMYKQFLLEK